MKSQLKKAWESAKEIQQAKPQNATSKAKAATHALQRKVEKGVLITREEAYDKSMKAALELHALISEKAAETLEDRISALLLEGDAVHNETERQQAILAAMRDQAPRIRVMADAQRQLEDLKAKKAAVESEVIAQAKAMHEDAKLVFGDEVPSMTEETVASNVHSLSDARAEKSLAALPETEAWMHCYDRAKNIITHKIGVTDAERVNAAQHVVAKCNNKNSVLYQAAVNVLIGK